MKALFARVRDAVWGNRAELASVAALVIGWSALWWGIGVILGRWIPQSAVWGIAGGLFLLSCFGWRLLRTIATVGLYALTRGQSK